MDFLHLQNGSDIRGVALELPGGKPVTLTAGACTQIAGAFVDWLAEKTGRPKKDIRIGVGHDSRVTAASLKSAACTGIAAAGACAIDCGLASTPAMFMGTVFPETAFHGSIMLTASHLPKERNGMKFFTPDGGLDKPDIKAILELAAKEELPEQTPAKLDSIDLMDHYTAFLRKKIVEESGKGDQPLAGLHIVVDAGNGAGGFFASRVLEPLGADCSGSQFLEPDGNFPNHIPNPEDSKAMDSIRSAVLAQKADLGLIFDTDVDRMSAVLPDGREVNRDALIALIAAILAPDHPGGTIVTDSVTSDRLTVFLEQELGLKHRRFKRGYKNVINESIRLNAEGIASPMAIETSGHGALQENYFLDDGAYLAVKLVSALAKHGPLDGLIAKFPSALEEKELRILVSGSDFREKGATALETFQKRAEEANITLAPTCEGVRITTPEGWLLLRQSLHDPQLPINVEGTIRGGCNKLLTLARKFLDGLDDLDLSILPVDPASK